VILRKLLGTAGYRIDAHELHAKLSEKPPPFVVDVRRRDEFVAGHVPGATLIPLPELGARLEEIPRDRPVVCVCRSGSRSGSAVKLLTKHGLYAENLRGGMLAWGRAGLPVRTGSGTGGAQRKRPAKNRKR
jgi:rhodanese-related sulfurtransferase